MMTVSADSPPDNGPVNQESQDYQSSRVSQDRQDLQRTAAGRSATPAGGSELDEYEAVFKATLPNAIRLAHQINQRFIDEADAGSGPWCSKLFHFIRIMKGHPVAAKATGPKQALQLIAPELRGMLKKEMNAALSQGYRLTSDPWEHFFETATPDAEVEFIDLWNSIRYVPGTGPLEQAIVQARRLRLLVTPEQAAIRPGVERDRSGQVIRKETDYEFFISIAGHLQVIMGDKPIFLPVERLGQRMGLSSMSISRYRKFAIEDRYLLKVKTGSYQRREADEFHFDVRWYSALVERAKKTTVSMLDSVRPNRSP